MPQKNSNLDGRHLSSYRESRIRFRLLPSPPGRQWLDEKNLCEVSAAFPSVPVVLWGSLASFSFLPPLYVGRQLEFPFPLTHLHQERFFRQKGTLFPLCRTRSPDDHEGVTFFPFLSFLFLPSSPFGELGREEAPCSGMIVAVLAFFTECRHSTLSFFPPPKRVELNALFLSSIAEECSKASSFLSFPLKR